jgi:O-antigen/teichoic acid export membrane protein
VTTAPTSTSRLGRVLTNAGLLLGGRTVNAVVSMGATALAGRSLGVTNFGLLVLISAFAQFIGEVVRFQSWQTVLHYGAAPFGEGRRPDFQRVVRFSIVLDLISAVTGVALGIGGVLLFGKQLGLPDDLKTAAALYALTIAILPPATALGVMRLFDRFKVLSAQAAVGWFARVIGAGIGFVLHAPLAWFLAVWAIGTLVSFLYLVIAAIREMHRHDMLTAFPASGPLTEGMPGAWRFAWATNAAGTLDVAFTHVATLLVGALIGPAQAALWRVGRQVADALAKPARLMVLALYPELAKLHGSEGEAAMRRLALQSGLVGGGVATVLLVATVLAGGPLLTLIMGEAFAPAAGIMSWQVAAAVIGVWAMPLEPMLVSLGRPGSAVRVRLIVSIAFIAALFPLTRVFGLTGAGIALVGAAAAMAVGLLIVLLMGRRAPQNRTKR